MVKMNRKVEYSLVALKHMSTKPQGTLTSAKEISETYELPFDATARALQHMAQSGLLRVEHGAAGGYCVARDLSIITLHDLINIVETPKPLAKCMDAEDSCELEKSCNIKSPMSFLNERLKQFYQGISVRELLDQADESARLVATASSSQSTLASNHRSAT